MTLSERAYAAIRQDIIRGTLVPGMPLRMAELSTRYGMGFSPLREALSRLQSERMVVAEALRGFRVAPQSVEEMRDAMQTRILIECDALRRAIALGDDDWAAGIVGALYALKIQTERTDQGGGIWELEARHRAFHLALLAACQSPWKLEFAERLYTATERYRIPILLDQQSATSRDVQAEHSDLATAVLDRDADRAADLLSRHYTRSAEAIAARFQHSAATKTAAAAC